MAQDEDRPLVTSSLAVGRFAAKQGSLRSPRGRLVASLGRRSAINSGDAYHVGKHSRPTPRLAYVIIYILSTYLIY